MSTQTTTARGSDIGGTERVSAGLWIALAAATLQFTAIASDFYQVGENVRDAWFGIPHTADLILLSALATVVLSALTAGDRSPVSGRTVGVIIGLIGLLATLQLGYRMIVPPFKGCLTFNCGFTPKADVTLLTGIWIGLVGNIGATLGGFIHAGSSTAKLTRPNFWVSNRQTGMTPWLGMAGLSAAAMFIVGFTFAPFYSVPKEGGDLEAWTAWLSIPHTSSLILLLATIIVGLVIAAGRGKAPMGPTGLGGTIAVLGFMAGVRTLYRILVSPFFSGPAEGVFAKGVQVHTVAYVALGFAGLAVVAGIAHAMKHRGSQTARSSSRAAAEPTS